jgi:Mn2+/Fe2+ NRAMP family transporter
LLIIAIVGTTVAPWQLFFQQSNVIDKRITPRFLPYERADTVLGSFVVIIGAGVITTVFTRLHAGTVAIWLAIALAAGVLVTGAWLGGG